MFVKEIKFTDFDGNERNEKFYFNLSKGELVEMELQSTGGITNWIHNIVNSKDNKLIFNTFKDIVLKAYGEKDIDGIHFRKSKEMSESFSQTPAYDELLIELVSSADAAAEFINRILPKEYLEQLEQEQKKAATKKVKQAE